MAEEDGEDRIASLEGRPPGDEDADPYAATDLAALPTWWRRAVEEYAAHELRAYRPPRFADGVRKRDVVERLEADLDVGIRLVCYDPPDAPWRILVDGEPVGAVERRRSVDGYSVFEVASDAFERLVREAASRGATDEPAGPG